MDETKYWKIRSIIDSINESVEVGELKKAENVDSDSKIQPHFLTDSECPELGNRLAYNRHLKDNEKKGIHVHCEIITISATGKSDIHPEEADALKKICTSAAQIANKYDGQAFRLGRGEISAHFSNTDQASTFSSELKQFVDEQFIKGSKVAICVGLGFTDAQAKAASVIARQQTGDISNKADTAEPVDSRACHLLGTLPPEDWTSLTKANPMPTASVGTSKPKTTEIKSPTTPPKSSVPKTPKATAPKIPSIPPVAIKPPALPDEPFTVPSQSEIFAPPPSIPDAHRVQKVDDSWIDEQTHPIHDSIKYKFSNENRRKLAEKSLYSDQSQLAFKQILHKIRKLHGLDESQTAQFNGVKWGIDPGNNPKALGIWDSVKGQVQLHPKVAHSMMRLLGSNKMHPVAAAENWDSLQDHVSTLTHELFHAAAHKHSDYNSNTGMSAEEGITEILAQHYTPEVLKHFGLIQPANSKKESEENLPLFTFHWNEVKTRKNTHYHEEVHAFAKHIAELENIKPSEIPDGLSIEEQDKIKLADDHRLTNAIVNHALKLKNRGTDRIDYLLAVSKARNGEYGPDKKMIGSKLETLNQHKVLREHRKKQNDDLENQMPMFLDKHIDNSIKTYIKQHVQQFHLGGTEELDLSDMKKHVLQQLHATVIGNPTDYQQTAPEVVHRDELADHFPFIQSQIDDAILNHPNLEIINSKGRNHKTGKLLDKFAASAVTSTVTGQPVIAYSHAKVRS
jgi:hypothetical protein